MGRRVSVVPHTHWDREWYATFQRFRLQLVELLDELLPRLETDNSYRHFLLDGQLAAVDDYLEVRPDAAERLTRLNRAGRLAMGPWYTLPDEFLVSGETLVRNLRKGLDRAAELGGAMPVGYLPDMFGHVAQMPQILRSFGFEHAVVWRGVPAAVDRSAFWWSAPDGSTVRAEYLPQGYGNGARLPDDAKDLVRLIDEFVDTHGEALVGPVLWMNGADHVLPRPWLGRVVAEANEVQDDYELVICSLADHLATAPTDDLPAWTGELRSGARSNLLMGVASNRVDVKQDAARAERTLERVAEPLNALFRPVADWPQRLFDLAWRAVVLNSAHDSVCACSADTVVDAVRHRYAEAIDIGGGLTEQALRVIGASSATRGALVVNSVAHTRSGVIELELPVSSGAPGPEADPTGSRVGDGAVPPWQQVVEETPALVVLHEIGIAEAATVVEREVDILPELTSLSVEDSGTGPVEVSLRVGSEPRESPPAETRSVVTTLTELARRSPERSVKVLLHQPPRRRALVASGPVPGFGWRAWQPVPSAPTVLAGNEGGRTVLSSGELRISVDETDATWSIGSHTGLGRLVDDGDGGDTYNYSPPSQDLAVDRPDTVAVEVLEAGPVRAAVAIRATYDWPDRIDGSRRAGSVAHTVTTRLELRSGERFVRVATSLENHSRDHRLRAWFPLPEPAATSKAECAFGTVERTLVAEGGPSERPLPTFPSRRFVQAGGLTIAHEGLLEYELVGLTADEDQPRASALALTLLRATGRLSQGPMTNRPLPAGPLDELEGPQMQGPVRVRYVVALGNVDPFRLADDAFVPLLVADGTGRGPHDGSHQALQIDGAVVSAIERRGAALHVRVFNPGTEPATVELPGRRGWALDLSETPIGPFENRVALAGNQILTLAVEE